jgi:hypothetical protein
MRTSSQTRRIRSAALVGASIVLVLAAGCAPGDGQGLDKDGNPLAASVACRVGPAQPASGNANATLDWVQANVFGGVCIQCHTGASAPLGLSWSSATNTCANTCRISQEIPAMKEIEAFDADKSYVYWKISGHGPAGEPIQGVQMPAQNPPLDPTAIQNIKDWINDGVPGC